MAQGRRDFLFGIDQGALAFKRLRGPKALYVGLHGHAPSTFPAADTRLPDEPGARLVRLPSGSERVLAATGRDVALAPERLPGGQLPCTTLAAGDRPRPASRSRGSRRSRGPGRRPHGSARLAKGDRDLRLADREGDRRRERRLVAPRRGADRAHAAGQGDRRQRGRSSRRRTACRRSRSGSRARRRSFPAGRG